VDAVTYRHRFFDQEFALGRAVPDVSV